MTGLRVVVTGLAGTYPFGGVFWDYFQYALGFHRLGHEVLYVEDTGRWCYHPQGQTFVADGAANAALLAANIASAEPELADAWFFRDSTGRVYGREWQHVVEFCRTADLFLHISASCWMRDEYFAADRVCFVDSDPMYTQASVPDYVAGTIDDEAKGRVDTLLEHDVFFTFAENIGEDDCRVPTELFDWVPTRQPVVLDALTPSALPVHDRRPVFTTVASWESAEGGPVVGGVAYGGKSREFERFMALPARSPLALELAMSGRAPQARLTASGWTLVDAQEVAADPWSYLDYLARSTGEWSVAKNAYVASRSGWFSCRSACYLALGVPVVVQDTGFSRSLPTGEGLLAFSTLDEAAAALEEVASAPERHARAARDLAAEHFDSGRVLGDLLERALSARVPG